MRDVQCKHCIEYKGNWCDKKRDDPDPDMVRDCHWFRTKTNGDRIRAMTDEELAVVLRDNCGNRECPPYHVTDLFPNDECLESCKMCWLDWLRREVEK